MNTKDVYNDFDLLKELAMDSQSAFSAIYQKYAPGLTGYAAARLPSLDVAHDILQDIFVFIWEERSRLKITNSLKAFLYAALRYRIIDFLRHQEVQEKYLDKLQLNSPTEQKQIIEHWIETKDLELTINKAINELPPRVKEVFKLSRDENMSIKEISSQLNISPQTVKNQISSALYFLRTHIKNLKSIIWIF